MKTRKLLLLLATVLTSSFLLAAHCDPVPPVDPSAPDAGGTGGESGSIDEQCAAACENMQRLQCPGYTGATPDGGTSCVTTCVANELSTVARWCPVEVSEAADCAEMESAWESCG